MLYREVGQYKTTYEADHAIFPLLQDRVGIAVILAIAFLLVPFIASDFVLNSMLIPILIFALAAIGLNLLTGYAGLISLGTGGFTSIPGAIVGGVIIGVGEKLGEFYWGPLLGSGIESWLAYMIALVFLLFRPQGLFGEKIIERV